MGAVALSACNMATAELARRQQAKDENNASEEAPIHAGTQIHMIVLALDYPGTGNELTCTVDGQNMANLAQMCGVTDLVHMTNNDCHKENVLRVIQEMGSRCEAGDYFIFNYSGHGANVPDKDGDEEDGQDESLCLVTPDGKIDWEGFLTDDDFAEAVTSSVNSDVKIILLCDCCHSGTIGDFRSAGGSWDGYHAVSMSGCMDSQTSGDTGKGGIFTHALLLAVQDMQEEDEDGDYSVAQLYNKQLEKDDEVFDSAQDITVKWTTELSGPQDMAWPLIPTQPFQAPWGQ